MVHLRVQQLLRLPSFLKIALLFLSVSIATPSFGKSSLLRVRLDSTGLSADEVRRAEAAILDVERVLPEKMKRHLGNVRLTFREMAGRKMGLASGKVIAVNRDLLKFEKPFPFAMSSKIAVSWEQLLIATLIHELSHVYDGLNVMDPTERAFKEHCLQGDLRSLNLQCEGIVSRNKGVSQHPDFLRSVGWLVDQNLNSVRRGSQMTIRSPDHYEFKSPEEAFAVNMEYFLLDAEFKCRRPSAYQMLRNILKHDPFSEIQCDRFSNTVFLWSSSPALEESFVFIPRERLYKIHWLHAGEGEAAMSSFGHSMLHLVICAPDTPMGPACVNDLSHHLVLTFRARVESIEIESLKGLNGSYPSVLFVERFRSILGEYAKDELRNLYSFPLEISRQEMNHILDTALELHWSYEGRYYFFSNNCATESVGILKRAIGDSFRFHNLTSHRPDILVQQLQQSGLVSLERRIEYPSERANLESLIGNLVKAGIVPPSVSLDTWLQVAEKVRHGWARRAISHADKSLVSNLFLLETRAASILAREARARVAVQIEKRTGAAFSKESPGRGDGGDVFAVYQAVTQRFRGAGYLLGNSSYGRPSEDEVARLKSEILTDREKYEVSNETEVLEAFVAENIPGEYRRKLDDVASILKDLLGGLGFRSSGTSEDLLKKLRSKKIQ